MFSRSSSPRTLLFHKFNPAIQCHHAPPPSRILPKNTHTTWPRRRQISNRVFVKKLFKDAYRDSPIMMTVFSVMYVRTFPPPSFPRAGQWGLTNMLNEQYTNQVCRRRCHHTIRQLHIYNLRRPPMENVPGSCRLPPTSCRLLSLCQFPTEDGAQMLWRSHHDGKRAWHGSL